MYCCAFAALRYSVTLRLLLYVVTVKLCSVNPPEVVLGSLRDALSGERVIKSGVYSIVLLEEVLLFLDVCKVLCDVYWQFCGLIWQNLRYIDETLLLFPCFHLK